MKRSDSRCGITLFEMMITLSVTGMLMVVTTGWMHQTMKFASTIRHRQRHHQSLTRLAWELRGHVRESQSLTMLGDDALMLNQPNGVRMTYTISGPTLLVEKRLGERDVVRETYRLAPSAVAVWDTSEMPEWISLVVSRGREGVPLERPEHSEFQPLDPESMPVDLHLRVGPHRWPEAGEPAPQQEEPQ